MANGSTSSIQTNYNFRMQLKEIIEIIYIAKPPVRKYFT